MPAHVPFLVSVVTGAAQSLVGAVVDRFGGPSRSGQGTEIDPATGIAVTALPVITQGVDPIQAGAGNLVAPIGQLAGSLIRRIAGPAAVVGGVVAVTDIISGGGGGGGAQPTTRKQVILATARANNPGATSKKIIRSARQCGLELAAATFGLNVLDVCFLIAQPASRRARGISAADMRCVSRTARKFSTLQHNLSHLCGPTRRYTRKK